jgi:beta-glucosidase
MDGDILILILKKQKSRMMMDRETATSRAKELVGKMTIAEVISQLVYDSPAIDRLHVPAYNWWNEALHGVARAGTATSFPQVIGLGATFDTALVHKIGDVISTEGRAHYNAFAKKGDRDIYKGLTFWAPNINIFRDPRWGRGQETYGEDPCLTGKLGEAFVKGIQGKGEYLKAAACVKHFAVHSGPESQRHIINVRVSKKDLWETYLPAFEQCVCGGKAEAVMGAYNRVNDKPCCANDELINKILRGKWHFQGHFVSDCGAINDFHENHKVTSSAEESAALALRTGCDLNCGTAYKSLGKAISDGLITESELRAAAVRLFATRFLLGLFDHTEYDSIPYDVIECSAHRRLALKAAAESFVLLKNNGILPLNIEKCHSFAVIGPNADSRRALIGNYYGTSSRNCTVLEGIRKAAGNRIRVLYAEGSDLWKEKPDGLAEPMNRLAEAQTAAEETDLSILCLGLDERMEGEEGGTDTPGEAGDKTTLELPVCQQKLLETVRSTGKPLIVLILSGSALDLAAASKADALMQVWYPGAEGGKAIADVLFGKKAPSGKLPITLYRDLRELPSFTDYSMKGRTYRYLEAAPLYPFGYGLTYGSLQVTDLQRSGDLQYARQSGVSYVVRITNRMDRPVAETLQAYIRMEGAADEVPNGRLCSFKRILAAPRQAISVTLKIPAAAFSVIDPEGEAQPEGDHAVVSIGFGQPDERTGELMQSGYFMQDVIR